MRCALPKLSVLLATVLLTTLGGVIGSAVAQPPQPAPQAAKALRAVPVDGATLVMKGERLVARLADGYSTHYFYKEGMLDTIHYSDGRFAAYYYDDDKRLERIELSDGQVQRAVYQGGALASIGNEAGQRLHVAPPTSAAGNTVSAVVGRQAPQASAAVPVAPARAAPAPADALNKLLIAVAGWEKNSWDCGYSPMEQTLCGGDGGRGPFGGGGWTADEGGPSWGGGWDGGNYAPYPTNLPTRMSCLAAATSTFEIMRDQVCPMVHDRTICMAQNHKLFDELWKECMATYPR